MQGQYDNGRLADVVNHLAPGAHLNGTIGDRALQDGSILWTLGMIVEAGMQDELAQLVYDQPGTAHIEVIDVENHQSAPILRVRW